MDPRYSPRRFLSGTAAFYANGHLNHGHVHDLSIPGCRLMTTAALQMGQSVDLTLRIQSDGRSIRAWLAVVRWMKDGVAGLEFIGMRPGDQARLREWVTDGAARCSSAMSSCVDGEERM